MIPGLVLVALLAESAPVGCAVAQAARPHAAPVQPRQPSPDAEPERGFFPRVGGLAPGAGLSAGGGYRDFGLFGSPLGFEVSALVSTRGYQLYRAHLGLLAPHRRVLDLRPADQPVASMLHDRRHPERGVAIYLDARYRFLPRGRFYGIGRDSRREDRTDYLLKGGALDLAVQGQITPRLGISARAGILDSTIEAGRDEDWPSTAERFGEAEAPGLLAPPRYLVAGIGAAFDTRDGLDVKRGAVFLSAVAWHFDDTRGDEFDFTRLALDGRTYLAPPALPGLVALRAILSTDLTAGNARVPFFLQGSLGGSDLLRAYGTARWRDRTLAHVTAEYRLPVHRSIEVAPFVDAGTVGPSLARLSGGLIVCTGVGLRARWGETMLGRMDVARGAEGTRVVFDLGTMF
jgi:hypothetical protein